MSTLTSLARAMAAASGTAQPTCTVRHVHLSPHPLVFIPLALAGEANAPLAALVGDDPGAPNLLVVPEPRDRDLRFAFAADLAAVILRYIESYFADHEPTDGRDPAIRYADAPQLLVPNPAGIAFTRLLGRSTRFRRAEGPYAVAESVPVLGRWLTFFADRSESPASSLMLAATDALSAHWATGQSPAEDRNLAALLGWIDPPPGTTGAQAAAAGRGSAALPIGWPRHRPHVRQRGPRPANSRRPDGQVHRRRPGLSARGSRPHRRAGHPADAHLDPVVAGGGTAARAP